MSFRFKSPSLGESPSLRWQCDSLISSSLNDPRHTTASELVRLLDACYLFTRCASKGPGKTITFDLGAFVVAWMGGGHILTL